MKILFLSDLNNVHTKKWISGLSSRGCEVCAFGLAAPNDDFYKDMPNLRLSFAHFSNQGGPSKVSKVKYLTVKSKLKKLYKSFKPDIVHAHYASSYGLLGSLLKHKPYLISVWGSDIFDFPQKSKLNKIILKRNLRSATHIFSTSHAMAKETEKYTDKPIEVIPFGVDLNLFKPHDYGHEKSLNTITIGIVKTLEKNYGIDFLIEAFKKIKLNNPKLKANLIIAGEGREKESLIRLTEELNISEFVRFTGFVKNNELPELFNKIDIVVIPSFAESFGVAAVEAAACEKPVIASNVGGLPEVVVKGETGLLCKPGDSDSIVEQLQLLIDDPDLRDQMGKAARLNAEAKYNWNNNVELQVSHYRKILEVN